MKNELRERLETTIMTGVATPISNDDVEDVLYYCIPAINPLISEKEMEDIICQTKMFILSDESEIIAVSFSFVGNMPVINFVFRDGELCDGKEIPMSYDKLKGDEEPITAFCYVLNCGEPLFSEFGHVGFKDYKRVF